MQRISDTLYGLLNTYTSEYQTFTKVTEWLDGSPMTDGKCDGTIFRKKDTEYFKLNWTGPVNVKWFGATGDGITNDTPFFQAAIDAFQIGGSVGNGVTILVPPGKYMIANLVMKTGTVLFADQQVAKDNFISNVPASFGLFGNPDYGITSDPSATNYGILNIYLEGDFANQPQLLAGVRLQGQKCFFIGNNINACAQISVLNEAGLVYIEKNGIFGWYGDAPTFIGTNDFRGALHVPAMGDSYIYDNEIGAGLSYFTSTVNPRDPVNGRIVALSLGAIFGGTSVISGNLFENGDRAVAIGNSLYCNFHNNRYELSAMGGLYIYGPMQFATFSQERFSDNSLSVDGAADDITIATGAGGNISFISPTFESLVNGAIPNSNFKVNYHISNYGSDLIDMVTPIVDPVYSVNGLVNLSNITNLPVRQVKGQYHPDDPQYTSVSTQKLPAETQVGYVKLKQGTDAATQSFVGAVEFWTPQNTIAYSIGFSPKEYLSLTGYETNAIFALNTALALQKNGSSYMTIWSLDGTGGSQIVLQGGPTVATQSIISLDNTTGTLSILGNGDIIVGSNENFRMQVNGITLIPFAPNPDTLANCTVLGRNSTTAEMVSIPAASFSPSTGGSGYIQNTLSGPQIADFRITGNGIIGTRLNIGSDALAAYPLQVAAEAGISAQFLGKVEGVDAASPTQLATLGQVPTAARTALSNTAPITYNSSTGVIGISDAAADGITKGAATFTAADFNSAAGVISIDYTNGQAASSVNKGFLTSADWTTFNSKVSSVAGLVGPALLLATGTTGTDFTISPSGSTITFNIPDASSSARGLVTTGVQTFAGNKTAPNWNATSSLTCTSTSANIYIPTGGASTAVSATAKLLYGGASINNVRVGLGGGATSTSITTNANAANVMVTVNDLTSATSGTHAFVSNLVVQRPTITSGGGTAVITNGVSLYVEGAPTFGTNSYAFYVASGSSKLSGLALPIVNKTANYTTTDSDYTVTVDTTGGNVTITLPVTGIPTGQIYVIKKTVAANTVTLDPTGAATIDGVATLNITTQWDKLRVQFDGTNYITI